MRSQEVDVFDETHRDAHAGALPANTGQRPPVATTRSAARAVRTKPTPAHPPDGEPAVAQLDYKLNDELLTERGAWNGVWQ